MQQEYLKVLKQVRFSNYHNSNSTDESERVRTSVLLNNDVFQSLLPQNSS